MAAGGFGKGVKRFFSDVVDGAVNGANPKTIKNINRLKSNMTDAQKAAFKNRNVKNIKLNKDTNVKKIVMGPNNKPTSMSGHKYNTMRNNMNVASQIGDAVGGGIRETAKGAKTGGVKGAIQGFTSAHTNADGSINWARAAGTFATVNVAGRVVTGGGLYKDRNGNVNIPGIPFL